MGLKASKSHRWVNCPGSYTLEQKYPSMPMTEDALRGLEEHKTAARILIGDNPTDGTEVSNAVRTYVDEIQNVASGNLINVEHRLPLTRDGITLNNIIDCHTYKAAENRFYVWDYKSGYYPVSAVGNWQLLTYAMAILDTCPNLEMTASFELTIIQPRISSTPDRWVIPAINLRSYRNQLFGAAAEALGDNPRTCSGNHCHRCSALAHCHSADEAGRVAVHYQGYTLDHTRTPDQLGVDLSVLKEAQTHIGRLTMALEQQLTGELKSGRQVIGWELGTGRGSQSWSQPHNAVTAMAKMYGVTVDKEALITPKQAITAGIPEAMVAAYSKVEPGALILKPSSDEELIRKFKEGL